MAVTIAKPLEVNKVDDPTIYETKEIVSSTITFVGESLTQNANEADPIFRLRRESVAGTRRTKTYAVDASGVAQFNQIFDDRETLFPPIPFSNSFSTAFDGINDFVDVGNPTNLQITGAMSISLWVKFAVNQNTILISKGGGSGSRGYNIQTDSGASSPVFNFSIAQDSTTTLDSGNSAELALNTWHHIVGVFNPSTALQIYVNGTLASENTTAIPATQFSSGLDFVIGSRSGPSSHYEGNIDEVAIWSRDLLASEVTTLRGTGEPGDVLTQVPSNLVSFWRMGDTDIFPILKDNKGTNDGTMTNMTASDIEAEVAP